MEKITTNNKIYPPQLKEIASPPLILYYRGDVKLLTAARLISIVGSRKATYYGLKVVKEMVRELVGEDFVTVSGLAIGIDQAVHEQTLVNEGKTIAVLGSAVTDKEIMPPRNRFLANKILEKGGLIISEYPEGSPVYPINFPARNRIIAGLSQATVVVEAAEHSGALITASYALQANREVMAVPGPITAPMSAGTNQLISRGAKPWLNVESLFDELAFIRKKKEKNQVTALHLSIEEQAICQVICNESFSPDEIISRTALAPQTVVQCLSELLLKGVIEEVGVQSYQLKT